MPNYIYEQPTWLYEKQSKIYNCSTRISLTMSGNKTGKTLSHAAWLGEQAMKGKEGMSYTWLSPYYSTSKIAFDLLKSMITSTPLFSHLENTKSKNRFIFNKTLLTITYPTGATIRCVSGDNVDSIYGHESYASVVDEASRVKEEAYNALLTTMFATNGPIKLVANPTIKNNWFFKLWKRIFDLDCHTDGYYTAYKLTALDAVEAGIMSKEVFDRAKKDYSPSVFKRDFLAEVPDGEVSVFDFEAIHNNVKNISKCYESAIYFGIDLGFTDTMKSDYSVITGLDREGNVVFYDRFKKVGQDLINHICETVKDAPAYIDKTGGGITVYELCKSKCANMLPYSFTSATKNVVIETLAHYVNNCKISYPYIEELLTELECYEVETSPRGVVSYKNGRGASHDDTVISLGLACLALKEGEELFAQEKEFNIFSIPAPSFINWG